LVVSKFSKEEKCVLFGLHFFESTERSLKSWLHHHEGSCCKTDYDPSANPV
jgi:hypothetical protein